MVVDPLFVAVVLLLAGVIASVVPLVPGGLLSALGVGYHWYMTGEPAGVALVGLLAFGLLTLVFDYLGSAVSARFGGASLRTTVIAGIAAIAFMFVLGPLGALLGIAAVVFVLEFRRHGDIERGVRTAAYATIGMLASAGMQIVLTATVLVAFLVIVIV